MFAAAAVMVSELLVVEVVDKRQANPLYELVRVWVWVKL